MTLTLVPTELMTSSGRAVFMRSRVSIDRGYARAYNAYPQGNLGFCPLNSFRRGCQNPRPNGRSGHLLLAKSTRSKSLTTSSGHVAHHCDFGQMCRVVAREACVS